MAKESLNEFLAKHIKAGVTEYSLVAGTDGAGNIRIVIHPLFEGHDMQDAIYFELSGKVANYLKRAK